MDNQLIKNDTLIFTLERQNEQGMALVQALKNVAEIEARVIDTEKRINDRFEQNEALQAKLAEELTINYEEQQELRSIIYKKSTAMTHEHNRKQDKFYSSNLFKAWKGLFSARIHAKLKKHMNITRYTAIRKLDFFEAEHFLQSINYDDFSERDLEPTVKILQVIELEKGENK